MIGNTLGQIAGADKLSVEQLRESIQNGTVPAYIGIPLLQEKVAQTKRMQEAQARPVQAPPIAAQVMQDAQQVAQPQVPMYQGLDNLPSNLPVTGMRGGGIVALADGGDLMDPYDLLSEEQQEEEDYTKAMRDMYAMASQMRYMGAPDKRSMPMQYTTPDVEKQTAGPIGMATPQAASQAAPQVAPQSIPQPAQPVVNKQQPDSGINQLIQGAAERYNLPPELMMNVASAESSGRPGAQNPRSSAKGVFQFIDRTWEGLGGTPGGQFNPEENVELGAKYLRQNAERLKSVLGRDPSYSEVYAAHYFGPGVTRMLTSAEPDAPIAEGLRTFNSPAMVDRILKSNPNLRGKTVGEVLASLERKAGSGIVNLAQGGVVGYAEGELVEEGPSTPLGRWWKSGFGSDTGYGVYEPKESASFMDYIRGGPLGGFIPQTEEQRAQAQQRAIDAMSIGVQTPEEVKEDKRPPLTPLVSRPVPKAPEVKTLDISVPEAPPAEVKREEKPAPKQEVQTEQKARTLYDEFLEDYKNSKSERERQKKMDAYMALATAGFAMAGGASPNAIQNIAQGAMAGMAQYGGARKAAKAAEIEDRKALLTAQRYQELGEAARATQQMAQARLTQDEQLRVEGMLRQIDGALTKQITENPMLISKTPEEKAAMVNALRAQDPQYNRLYEQLYGRPFAPQTTAPRGQVIGVRPG